MKNKVLANMLFYVYTKKKKIGKCNLYTIYKYHIIDNF